MVRFVSYNASATIGNKYLFVNKPVAHFRFIASTHSNYVYTIPLFIVLFKIFTNNLIVCLFHRLMVIAYNFYYQLPKYQLYYTFGYE